VVWYGKLRKGFLLSLPFLVFASILPQGVFKYAAASPRRREDSLIKALEKATVLLVQRDDSLVLALHKHMTTRFPSLTPRLRSIIGVLRVMAPRSSSKRKARAAFTSTTPEATGSIRYIVVNAVYG